MRSTSRFLVATTLCAALSLPTYADVQGAKNIILMVSDGVGFNGWLAVDYYQGLTNQQSYQVTRPDGTEPFVYGVDHHSLNLVDGLGRVLPSAEDVRLAAGAVAQGYDPMTRWNRFENTIRNDFPPVEERYTSYTDSAAAGTALMAGRKTSNGRINQNWSGAENFRTIAQIAMDHDMSAGAVASVMLSHATPAAVIAHNVSRNNYVEIANEMFASDLAVIMGAGHPLFDNSGNQIEPEDEDAYRFVGGSETLAALTRENGLNGFSFVDSLDDFQALANGTALPDRVIGVAQSGSTLQASREDLPAADTPSGMAYNRKVPSLATMSLGALNVLNQDEDGFFVMIEGGAVDWMGHANNMPRFIEEQIDFNLAVDSVIEWVEEYSSWEETLLIVTSDHETGGIWGEGTWTNGEGGPIAADSNDETLLAARFHPTEDIFNEYLAVQDRGVGKMPGYMFSSRNHTNELVPLWALGAGSELFAQFTQTDLRAAELWGDQYEWNGSYVDNTTVFHVMNETMMAYRPLTIIGQ